LPNASGPWGDLTYYYDLVGNRTYPIQTPAGGGATTTHVHTYPATSNRISSVRLGTPTGTAVRTFTHDGAGNITQDVRSGSGTYNYTMNQRNRLASASVGSTQVGNYVYDALERLAIRTTANVTPAGTTHFAYDLSGKVLVEANGSNGASVREYVWFDDMPLAIVADVDTASPQLLHVHANHLDRPILLTIGTKANV
jgi:6-phosphogluconolactonase (cycloisomerase 2 family)